MHPRSFPIPIISAMIRGARYLKFDNRIFTLFENAFYRPNGNFDGLGTV